jgi:hypothetical protein
MRGQAPVWRLSRRDGDNSISRLFDYLMHGKALRDFYDDIPNSDRGTRPGRPAVRTGAREPAYLPLP